MCRFSTMGSLPCCLTWPQALSTKAKGPWITISETRSKIILSFFKLIFSVILSQQWKSD
jgi:hypothetical protein